MDYRGIFVFLKLASKLANVNKKLYKLTSSHGLASSANVANLSLASTKLALKQKKLGLANICQCPEVKLAKM
jgi:hypothetical protein